MRINSTVYIDLIFCVCTVQQKNAFEISLNDMKKLKYL